MSAPAINTPYAERDESPEVISRELWELFDERIQHDGQWNINRHTCRTDEDLLKAMPGLLPREKP
jgi:hypothetical protein